MRFLKRLILVLVLLVLIAVGAAFLLPSHYHLERSVVIARPASEIHAILNGYRRFNEWSPWAAKDPNAKYSVSGPETGVGAKQSWVGDPKTVGSGSQEITESTPGKSLTTALDFGDMGKSTARFLLAPEGQGTRVTWTLDGDTPITLDGKFLFGVIGRYMTLSMDKMVTAILADLERVAISQFIVKPIEGVISNIASSMLSIGGARASGGPVAADVPYLVGEQGPELFVPSSNGSIAPNSALAAGRPQIVLNVQTKDAPSFFKSEPQLAAMMSRALARGQRNL